MLRNNGTARIGVSGAIAAAILAFIPGDRVARSQAEDARGLIDQVIAHESEASAHRGHYIYESEERSERTGGHLWRERVAETPWGKLRYLIAEDGIPLSGGRLAAERARIADEAAHPEEFKKAESARADDEQHARQMLTLLPKAFEFDPPKPEGDYVRVAYHPNPGYSPSGMEEKVLHGMSGSVLIEPRTDRVREIEGRMPQDVSLGWGLLATVKAGSNFSTLRTHVDAYDWKTEAVHTDINGKAMFLKTIARQQQSKHWDFKRISDSITVPEAARLIEQ